MGATSSNPPTTSWRLFLTKKIKHSNVIDGLFKGRWRESVFSKDNHCLAIKKGKKNFQIYLLPVKV